MTIGVLAIGAIVVVAVVLMVVVGRQTEEQRGPAVDGVGPDGLVVGDELVEWSSIFEIVLLTRRQLSRTWFGFEIRTETHGLLRLDGSGDPGGLGQEFLAECHRFPGFDHAGVTEGLASRSERVLCFSR